MTAPDCPTRDTGPALRELGLLSVFGEVHRPILQLALIVRQDRAPSRWVQRFLELRPTNLRENDAVGKVLWADFFAAFEFVVRVM